MFDNRTIDHPESYVCKEDTYIWLKTSLDTCTKMKFHPQIYMYITTCVTWKNPHEIMDETSVKVFGN